MSRSPLAYPLNRSADMDVGGAADLQTDIMRFMAILSLCLVAIFALVQSLPLNPAEPVTPVQPELVNVDPTETGPEAKTPFATEAVDVIEPVELDEQVEPEPVLAKPAPQQPVADEVAVSLTRPKWVPKFTPAEIPTNEPVVTEETTAPPPPSDEPDGFVLRFESDAALMRAVAASHVGLYAIEEHRAQRMTVSESRVSFWDASTPNTFHEMEAATVPRTVFEALARTGADTEAVSWGVTLPGKLKTRLDALMQAHQGGSLIIGAGGDIHWEAT